MASNSDSFFPSVYLRYQPVFQVLLGAFLISFSAILVKLAQVSPTASGFYRVFFGAVFLFIGAKLQGARLRLEKDKFLLSVFCGLIFAFNLFFWHRSIMYIGPGLSTLISNFQVFFLAVIGFFFLGETLRLRFVAALPLAIGGLFLIVGTSWNELSPGYKTGIYLSLLTAVCYTIFLLTIRKIHTANNHSHFLALLFVSVFCALFLGLKMIFSGDSFIIPDLNSLLCLAALGLFCQTVGWILIATAMPKIRASFTGLILLLQPTLSFVWDVLFFDRPTNLLNWTGVCITLSAIYMGLTAKKQHN
ncbi:DMT family transporter [Desulforhopalus singaporensis]|uniref:EamA domain-containing membrane protein RarD n=1 Tax=Desulforhopalus singaporensis TaxID=91360 RepID=A0A1H0L2H5_9BACT|nr:DMT family transporter [Desulforhopalus singaporensis]SDO62171.1 EamA domain-containing membrane protein RarD [Desulforhopalus singaporensis]